MNTSPEPEHAFSGRVFVGTSLDGFIARPDGELDWLNARAEDAGETGYDAFMAGIDTIVMGRNTYEKTLTFGFWPYAGLRVLVLSTELSADDAHVTVVRTLPELLRELDAAGAGSVYVDGGRLVQTFLREGLIDQLIITTAPVLLGQGIPLFGALEHDIELTLRSTRVLGAGFTQATYTVN